MKTKLYTFIFASVAALAVNAQQETAIANKQSLPKGVQESWFDAATAVVNTIQYDFYNGPQSGSYRVANNANRLGFEVSASGYTAGALRFSPNEESWTVGFRLQMPEMSGAYIMYKKDQSITYQWEKAAVEYVNDPSGFRQNFIVSAKPNAEGPLTIRMAIETSMDVSLRGPNKLAFSNAGKPKEVKMYYQDLKVWDANHQSLDAHMELDEQSRQLSIVVNDENAVYPITVDPLNQTAEWTTSADGILPGLLTNLQLQVQTTYGYTVTGLGDINGDGFDDVAVSAPTMADVISGTGSLSSVGAVFVYLGSATGLSTTPSKVLQPNTAVTGALFGLSVDAGDISGDGKNDIVIGAPLDRYQTAVDGLFGGTVNVNVTAGKVYYYRSEDLLASSNPTPFLQIRLQGSNYFSLLGNLSVTPLFGYAVAVTNDLNADGRADLIVGAPTYAGVNILSVKNGAAYVFYSDNLNTTSPAELSLPTPSLLGITSFPLLNSSGLLYGFSVDGVGDFNMDGKADVVVGAPAGIDLSSLGSIFTGQVLGGSAYVYYGSGTASGINTAIGCKLTAGSSGLLGNAANLFGYKVKGTRNGAGARNGNILVGAPAGSVLSNVVNGLRVKAGQIGVFVRSASLPASPSTAVTPTQTLSSPRSSSILSILSGQSINLSLLYGASMDNMLDVNCDGIGDLIAGEPASTNVPLLGANVVGGSAYVYTGKSDGTYNSTPIWTLTTSVSPLLGVNATSLIGYSVAGARYIMGRSQGVRALVGGPANALDFGSGLLNLGNTLGTTLSFVADNNGLGKAYLYSFTSCNITLPVNLVEFTGNKHDLTVELGWTTVSEDNFSHYELERSTDGIRYTTLAMVFAKGEPRNNYGYTDRHPYMGVNYYRLKMIDKNGQFKYSQVVTASFDQKLPADVVVAPNPVKGSQIHVKLIGLSTGVYRMELHNSAGQLLQASSLRVTQFEQFETITRPGNTPSGIYWLNVYDDTNTRVKTVRVFMNNE